MTVLLPTPRTIALHAARGVSAGVGRILLALLAPAPSRARHRALSPMQVRWQRWKSALSDYVATALHVPLMAPPARPGPARAEGALVSAWSPLHPDTRTAQPPVGAQRDDHRWPTEPPAPTGHAPPPAQPVQAIQWPQECPEVGVDPWVEPGATWPAVARFAVDGPGVVEPDLVEQGDALRLAADDLDDLDTHQHDGRCGAEDTDVWEFQVGDLARWWDEAAARLDAAARDQAHDRRW